MKVMRPTLMTTSIYTLSIRQVSTGPKPRLVVVGSGWGGFRCARDVDKTKYDVTVVSPRNHFLFTPLLPSTTVGTLEFRCVQEPVRTIKDVQYVQASAREIDFSNKEVVCKNLYERGEFKLKYDKLVLAVGTKSNTFGVPGFESTEEDQTGQNQTGTNKHNVFFLKQLQHARSVRNRIIDCFERASSPAVTQAEKRRLLSFIVVGGGPISVEFTSELHQFLETEVCRKYPNLVGEYSITLVESGKHLLGSFDKKVSNYVENLFKKRKITMLTGEGVKEVKKNSDVQVLGDLFDSLDLEQSEDTQKIEITIVFDGFFFIVQPSDAALFVNALHYDMDYTDMFTIIDAVRREERMLGGLGRIGLDHKQVSALMALDLSGKTGTYGVDVRDSAVNWVNNIEVDKMYRTWLDNIQEILRPTFPGMLQSIR